MNHVLSILSAGAALLAAPAFSQLSSGAAPAMSAGLPYAIVSTEQSACYDDRGMVVSPKKGEPFYGQDAQRVTHPASYHDNGDGTITDRVTGLMWQKGFKLVEWRNAHSDAAADRTAGYSDWRVPTIKELYSLVNFDGRTGSAPPEQIGAPKDARPYLDTRVFAFEYPSRGRFIDAQYLSATTNVSRVMERLDGFYGVNFADGRIKCYPKEGNRSRTTFYARYVRGNPVYGRNDFHDNSDGTITDRATGLTWMKVDSGDPGLRARLGRYARQDGRLDWREALDFASRLDYAGKSDWRLPNAKELQSLVDYLRSVETSDSASIDALFSASPIMNEGEARDFGYYWSSTTHLDGRVPGSDAVYVAFGRALGYMRPPSGTGTLRLMDVHGPGAQRGDPKTGDPSKLPLGQGPQGDVRRIYNLVRCVRG